MGAVSAKQQQEQIILCRRRHLAGGCAAVARVATDGADHASLRPGVAQREAGHVRAHGHGPAVPGGARPEPPPRRDAAAKHPGRAYRAGSLVEPDANLGESALLALTHSFPQRARGVKVSRVKVLKCHREAWKIAALDDRDPRRILLLETDPLVRALRAAQVTAFVARVFRDRRRLPGQPAGSGRDMRWRPRCSSPGAAGNSGRRRRRAVRAALRPGRHAPESPRNGEGQQLAAPSVAAHRRRPGPHDADDPETTFASNLLVGLFASGERPPKRTSSKPWRPGSRLATKSRSWPHDQDPTRPRSRWLRCCTTCPWLRKPSLPTRAVIGGPTDMAGSIACRISKGS